MIGYGNSTLDDLAASVLAGDGRVVVPDTQPEKGSFYRSDHFEFAQGRGPGLLHEQRHRHHRAGPRATAGCGATST